MIEIKKYKDLTKEIKANLASFIDTEFGHIPIVKETEWANPDWTLIKYEAQQIVSFYNIVIRSIRLDQSTCKVGGINNVITPKKYRGNGHASHLLKETEGFIFEELNCALGLLLCADALIPFYQNLSWYSIDCPVYFNQSGRKKLWTANTMLLSREKQMIPNEIDLNGLPW